MKNMDLLAVEFISNSNRPRMTPMSKYCLANKYITFDVFMYFVEYLKKCWYIQRDIPKAFHA